MNRDTCEHFTPISLRCAECEITTLQSDLAAARDEIAALRAIARSAAQEEETKLDENQFITQQSRIVKLAALREAGYLKENGDVLA